MAGAERPLAIHHGHQTMPWSAGMHDSRCGDRKKPATPWACIRTLLTSTVSEERGRASSARPAPTAAGTLSATCWLCSPPARSAARANRSTNHECAGCLHKSEATEVLRCAPERHPSPVIAPTHKLRRDQARKRSRRTGAPSTMSIVPKASEGPQADWSPPRTPDGTDWGSMGQSLPPRDPSFGIHKN